MESHLIQILEKLNDILTALGIIAGLLIVIAWKA